MSIYFNTNKYNRIIKINFKISLNSKLKKYNNYSNNIVASS